MSDDDQKDPKLKLDGRIGLPTVIAVVGACLTLWGAVATNAAETKAISIRQDKLDMVPERLSAIEAYQKSQKETLEHIELKLEHLRK